MTMQRADLSDPSDMLRTADLSPRGTYRYGLTRVWGSPLHLLPFIMLNPSTADALIDDPTIRRCIGFAKRLGYGGIEVRNLYAFRATKPDEMWAARAAGVDIIGPRNDTVLTDTLMTSWTANIPVVAAWGALAKPDRAAWLLSRPGAAGLHCLGLTKLGAPRHPLYLKADSPLQALAGEPRAT